MAFKVLFHSHGNGKHCPDGFAAAFVAWTIFGDDADYIPCVYQEEPPTIEQGDTVYLLDFSYPRAVLEEWATRATVRVLDHHKTAQAALEGLSFAIFDMERSGAQLAWDFFKDIDPEPYPDLIHYVADRDLWTKELPFTEEVHCALQTFPQDFRVWGTLARLPNYVDFMRRIGEPIHQKRMAEIEDLASSARWKTLSGHRVLCINTTNYSLVSDALNVICKRHPETPFAVNFSWMGQMDRIAYREKLKLELRSVGDFDVSVIAKSYRGGGHKNAAGCVIGPDDWAYFLSSADNL